MASYIREQLLSNWNFMRLLRLLLGGALIAQSWQVHELSFGLLGGFVAMQGLLNMGCGAAACNTPFTKGVEQEKEPEYTEIK